MIMSLRGFQGEPDPLWQYYLYEAIEGVHPPGVDIPIGNPLSVATVVTVPPVYVPVQPVPGPAPNPYAVTRTSTPNEACAAVADALLTYGEPSAVLVLAGGHWVVIYGGDGQGEPQDPAFRIDSFWMCNPDNGYFGGIPGGEPTPRPEAVRYTQEWVCYADFVDTYFTPAPYYTDGLGQYAVATDANAKTQPFAARACPSLSPADSVAPAIEAFLETRAGARFAGTTQSRYRRVERLDRENAAYYLVPFVHRDGSADVLRFDTHGRHLGTAFGIPYGNLYQDTAAVRLVMESYSGCGERTSELHSDTTLVWHPSRESKSAYNPFYRVRSGDHTAYVSLGGLVVKDLHQLTSGEAFDPASYRRVDLL